MFRPPGFRNSTGGNRIFGSRYAVGDRIAFKGPGSAEGKPGPDKTLKGASTPRVQPFFSDNGTVFVDHAAGFLPFDTSTGGLVHGLNPKFVVRPISGQNPGRLGVARPNT